VKTAVSGLENEFAGQVKTENLNAREEESHKVIKEQGFATHGLLIRNAKDEVVWRQADHKVKMKQVRAEIRRLLKSAD